MIYKLFFKELKRVFDHIHQDEVAKFVDQIKKASRVYVVGSGRSGLVAKNLAMRLVRLKKKTFVIGETVTPTIKTGDLLVAVSGSGESTDVLSAVKISRVLGARILGITAKPQSALAKLSHTLIMIPAQVPQRLGDHYQLRELIGMPERSPVKSLFEVCALIFLDISVNKLKHE